MHPPKKALRFLRWFCREDYLDEIEGDLIELFEKRSEESPKKAKRRFVWDVVKSFRIRNIRSFSSHSNQIGMYKNYVKIALRVFSREKSFTFINLLGLSTALALTLLIVQYAEYEFSYEKMYPKYNDLVRLTVDYMDGGVVVGQDCETYPPIGKEVTELLPEVENFARAYRMEWVSRVVIGEEYLELDQAYAVDPYFFTMFNYEFLEGNKDEAFIQPHEVVLTESTAFKYFGKTEVVGEFIEFPTNEGISTYKVVGVIKDSPSNTHLKVDLLVSYPSLIADYGEKDNNWNGNNTYTYLELAASADYQNFERGLGLYCDQLEEEDKMNDRIISQKIADIHLYSKKTFEPEPNGDAQSVYFLLGVAFLVIIIALVNYINLATSKAMDRAKEVGIRKVVGSTVGQLRTQFFVESSMINIFSFILALFMIALTLPLFMHMADLPSDFSVFSKWTFWRSAGSFLLVSIILSGGYPALVLSSFKISKVLKGRYSHSSGGVFLRKSLVVFQFAITIMLLSQTLAVREQLIFMKEKDLGVNVDKTVVVRAPMNSSAGNSLSAFKQSLLSNAHIESIAFSDCVPGLPTGDMSTTTGINLTDAVDKHSYNFYIYFIDSAYIPLMEMELLAGENYGITSDSTDIIVTEETIRLWGLSSPEEAIGKKVDMWGRKRNIHGVIKDYNQESAKSGYMPIILMRQDNFGSFASIKFNGDDVRQRLTEIETSFLSAYPNRPFSYFFLDQKYDEQFRKDEQFRHVFEVLTGFAILIACLGLFGLASFVVSKRTKEIGIRKVIGASMTQILVMLSSEFVKTVFVAIVISLPITYYLVTTWLENFAFRIDASWWLFAIPSMLVLFFAIASVSVKSFRVARENPVTSLRDE